VFTNTDFSYPYNHFCNADGTATKHVIGTDIKARTKVKCGVTMDKFFTCHDEDTWESKESTRWIEIGLTIGGLVLLHALIPIHFIPFFGR